MPILQITTITPGLVGVYPRLIYVATNDTLNTVSTTGYLSNYNNLNPGTLRDGDMALVVTRTTPGATDLTSTFLQVTYSAGGVWSLTAIGNAGDVTLPTTLNHIATYTGTTGALSQDPSTAISAGNIQAGLSGTAGALSAFPATAARGSLRLLAANNAGDTITTITNASFGQATTITIPDPGVATSSFVLSDGGTQTITTGNFQVLAGDLIAGSEGNAGNLQSYPPTSSNGELIIAAIDAGADFSTTISNSTIGQNTVVSIPDPGASTANFLLSKSATVQQVTAGNLQVTAGSLLSGSAAGGFVGLIEAFPTTASSGFIAMQAAVNGSGNFGTTLSNATTQAQSQVLTIPDVGGAAGNVVVKGAAGFVSGNLVRASGTAGLLVDSGIVGTTVMLTTAVNTLTGSGQIILQKANGTEAANAVTASGNAGVITTSSLTTAAGATYSITWTNTKITATSVIGLTIQGGTNTVQSIQFSVVPGAGTATLVISNIGPTDPLNGTILIGYSVL